MKRLILSLLLFLSPFCCPIPSHSYGGVDGDAVLDIGSRLELFVDHFLIGDLHGVSLRANRPIDAGPVVRFDRLWEGPFSMYCTVIKDGPLYRLYYRGSPKAGEDGNDLETTCYAQSTDGINWTKPDLGLFEVNGTRKNNVVLANQKPFSTNFSPLLDARPGVPKSQRYKALAGVEPEGLFAFVSADGIRWKKLIDRAVITKGAANAHNYAYDSQNVAFWSEAEQTYVCYFRTFKMVPGGRVRSVSRTTSSDFIRWSEPVPMSYGDTPPEHIYTNQTHPYFRAPHIYIGLAARFMPKRRVLTDEQVKEAGVDPLFSGDVSDTVLISSRGDNKYDRTFMESYIRPEIGFENWTSRTNYAALNVVPTGRNEMSIYVHRGYAQRGHHLRRYVLVLDRFSSVNAPYEGGEFVTKPFKFKGNRLYLNYSTSAAGDIRLEIQDSTGKAIPGYTLEDAVGVIGNEIERVVSWKSGQDVSQLEDRPIRLRFVMKDADIYSMQFR